MKPDFESRGFTLIEIMVVVVIIGILAALIVPNIVGRGDQARVTAAKNDLRSLAATLDLYRLDNSHYPSNDQGLEALVTRPDGFPEPRNYATAGYIRKMPVDQWGSPFIYLHDGDGFDLYSMGSDGADGGEGLAADIYFSDL
ncbi:MAG: type II secretion system major pseudopilin GspG [Gammaproteobacteria bacterium]|nr:type II secretion system major pseudopilin GspG [Gammaproteobacteria bacterium]